MQHQPNLLLEISRVLKEIGNKKCLEKAKSLNGLGSPFYSLSFRNLGLGAKDVLSISSCINQFQTQEQLKSISFSFNQSLGNEGVKALVNNLPKSLTEIGLVDCGISDEGAKLILDWIKTHPNLNMICMENNPISEEMNQIFKNYNTQHPDLLLVY